MGLTLRDFPGESGAVGPLHAFSRACKAPQGPPRSGTDVRSDQALMGIAVARSGADGHGELFLRIVTYEK